MTDHVLPGVHFPAHVVITVYANTNPGQMNLNTIGPVTRFLKRVATADSSWRPI
jgi:hypothetical protein